MKTIFTPLEVRIISLRKEPIQKLADHILLFFDDHAVVSRIKNNRDGEGFRLYISTNFDVSQQAKTVQDNANRD